MRITLLFCVTCEKETFKQINGYLKKQNSESKEITPPQLCSCFVKFLSKLVFANFPPVFVTAKHVIICSKSITKTLE